MAGNTSPIYSRVGDIQWVTLTTANTAKDGTGTAAVLFTADATNGGRVERVRAVAKGNNIASVLRLFINNGATAETAGNNSLYAELSLPATTLSEVAKLLQQELPNPPAPATVVTNPDPTAFPLVLPPGYRLLATIGTTVAAGWQVTAVGGEY